MAVENYEQKDRTHRTELQLTCPACGGSGVFSTWDCIDGGENQALRQRVLHDEGLFFYQCPRCRSQIRVESPCLYIDKIRKFMVWHIPDPKIPVTSQEVCTFLGEDSFAEYHCRAALTWGEWREKIIEIESGYDDRLYEIIKYGAYQLIKEADREKLPLEAYHLDLTEGGSAADVSLVFMEKDRKGMGYVYDVTPKAKDVTADIFLPLLQRIPAMNETGRFDRFSYSWAQQFVTQVIKAASAGQGQEAYGQLIGFWVQTLAEELFHAEVAGKSM